MTGTKGAHVITWDNEIGVIELFFPDLAEAKEFYTDVLGLEVDREDDTSPLGPAHRLLRRPWRAHLRACPPPRRRRLTG